MSDVAVSDLKGGHAPAQKVFQGLRFNIEIFSTTTTGWGDEGGHEATGERERKAC